MTSRDMSNDEFDRLMSAWFDAEADAAARSPEWLTEAVLDRTARIRYRPAWLLPERWLPMQLHMTRPVVPRPVLYAALVALLILALVAVASFVGAPRPAPFAPFGPAGNGRVFLGTSSGDIVSVDPVTGASTTIVDGEGHVLGPRISRDGTRVAFAKATNNNEWQVYAVDARGGRPLALTAAPLTAQPLDVSWSPDGRQVAWDSGGELWVAKTDGSGARSVNLGLGPVSFAGWRPPAGEELLVRGGPTGSAGLYLVKLDGSAPLPLTPADGSEFEYSEAFWAPDGKRLAYNNVPENRAHVLTIEGLADRAIEPGPGSIGTFFPKWSPDGTKLAMLVQESAGHNKVGVVAVDDPAARIILTGPSFSLGPDFDWSPDGRQIQAVGWSTSDPWLLDPAGGRGHRAAWTVAGMDEAGDNLIVNSWQRVP